MKDESVTVVLSRESRRELPAVEGVDRVKLPPCVKQLCNPVGRVFNVSKDLFARFLRTQYEHKKEISLRPEHVLDVSEVTNELIWVVTARSLGTWIGAKEQCQVKDCFVRAINDRGFLRKPVETVSAVSALGGISLHRNAPGPGADSCSQGNRTRPKTPTIE